MNGENLLLVYSIKSGVGLLLGKGDRIWLGGKLACLCGMVARHLYWSFERTKVRVHLAWFQNVGIFVHFTLCLLKVTLKAVGPFYLMSMLGEAKVTTRGKCVTNHGLTKPIIDHGQFTLISHKKYIVLVNIVHMTVI